MKLKLLMTAGSITTAVAASMVLFAAPAMAQNTCDLNGTDAGNNAADANDGATATGTDALACGRNATADQAGGVAIGTGATATGPGPANPIYATVAVGYNATAQDNAVAIGNTASARFSGTVNPLATGINSAVGVGAGAVAVGANTVAIGTTSRAGTGFAVNTPGAPVNAGSNITVVRDWCQFGGHSFERNRAWTEYSDYR
jgi:trimeric autotransporter adhesin